MTFKPVIFLITVMGLMMANWGNPPVRPAWAASEEGEMAPSEADEDGGRVESLDELLAEVAARVPGFGWLFLGSDGVLHVYLLDGRLARAAQGAIETLFGRERFPLDSLHVLPGQYSFLQLREWHERMLAEVLGLPGVILTDIDEAKNRLRVGVEAQEQHGVV